MLTANLITFDLFKGTPCILFHFSVTNAQQFFFVFFKFYLFLKRRDEKEQEGEKH